MQERVFQLTTFPSELGWMAALGRGKTLSRLVFGHRSPQQAVAALKAEGRLARLDVIGNGDWTPVWIARLQAFARGENVDLRSIPLELGPLTPFQQRVLDLCRRIPYGQTMTYGQLAAAAGVPRAARAVGNVMATNCLPLVIPCHRVVPAGGQVLAGKHCGGYSAAGGVRMKLRLLEAEAQGSLRRRISKRLSAAV